MAEQIIRSRIGEAAAAAAATADNRILESQRAYVSFQRNSLRNQSCSSKERYQDGMRCTEHTMMSHTHTRAPVADLSRWNWLLLKIVGDRTCSTRVLSASRFSCSLNYRISLFYYWTHYLQIIFSFASTSNER
jgi:hypothetical protein